MLDLDQKLILKNNIKKISTASGEVFWEMSLCCEKMGLFPEILIIINDVNTNEKLSDNQWLNILPIYCFSVQVWFTTRGTELGI